MGVGALSGDISGTMRNLLGITDEFFNKVYDGVIGKHAFGVVPVLLKPKSRGRIMLKSKNPFKWPKLIHKYFDHQSDLKRLVEGIKMVT